MVDAVASLLRGRRDEELEASRPFDELSKLAVEKWSGFVSARPHRRTESLVARLAAEGHRDARDRPRRALAIFAVAEGMANEPRDVFRIAEWRARLARGRAHALLSLRLYSDALEAIDSAEAFLAHVRDAAYELPFARWIRAMVFFEIGRYAEALPLAVSVVRAFEKCEDIDYANQVRILVADICHVRGETEDALSMYRVLLPYFEQQDDDEIAPPLRAKIAACESALAAHNRS